MHVCQEVAGMQAPIFVRLHFVISFFAGSFGPSNVPFGCIWVPLWAPNFKKKLIYRIHKIMDLNQYLDRMNTKTIII